ncbi:isochorismate synthase [Actinospongicola halichondriae]|uniref:isochorismate synthase n=1 Tax=Actinospongicola halichondriae TaxID=3236844 RepID=UPI003D48795B
MIVARTRRLDTDVDLLDVAGVDGSVFEKGADGLAGRGEAMRVEVPSTDLAALTAVTDALAAITVDDDVGRPGTGPVAFAAIPFDPAAPATFVVPRILVGRAADGTRWVSHVGDEDDLTDDVLAPRVDEPRARRFEVQAVQDPDWWKDSVRFATKRIADGAFDKVVLAREILVTADAPISRLDLLRRLRRSFPGCFSFAVGSMVGASPELLVSRSGEMVHAHPMAGTAPRGGDPTTDARLAASLLASTKDRAEHQITIDMVWETLLPYCSYVDSEPEPSVVAVANVQHLASLVEGRLSQPPASILELVSALHPTPAVSGWPLEPALEHLAAHEGLDRDRYAGAVGWVDAAGNGTWSVGIRSALLDGSSARLFAGVGVVSDSDPDAELAETDAKFQAVLSAILRP